MIGKITHGLAWRGRKVKRIIRRKGRRLLAKPRRWMVKIYKYMTLKKLYPSTYRKYAKNPVKENKIVFLEVRLQELTDNFQRIYTALQKKGGYELVICHIGDGL